MSKRKDEERAKSGYIFRDGHLIRKEEWPGTPEHTERQKKVDRAVDSELKKKFEKKHERREANEEHMP